jgi:hypothetical protein
VAAADQGNLDTHASITDITSKVEYDWRDSVMKLAQAHLSVKMVYTTIHKDLQLSKKSAK